MQLTQEEIFEFLMDKIVYRKLTKIRCPCCGHIKKATVYRVINNTVIAEELTKRMGFKGKLRDCVKNIIYPDRLMDEQMKMTGDREKDAKKWAKAIWEAIYK